MTLLIRERQTVLRQMRREDYMKTEHRNALQDKECFPLPDTAWLPEVGREREHILLQNLWREWGPATTLILGF